MVSQQFPQICWKLQWRTLQTVSCISTQIIRDFALALTASSNGNHGPSRQGRDYKQQSIGNPARIGPSVTLSLSDNYIDEAGYKVLLPGIGRSQLEVLDMENSFISDQEIPALAAGLPLTNLTTVILDGNNISDVGASLLAEAMTQSPRLCHISLTDLTIANAALSDENIIGLAKGLPNSNLKTLNLKLNYFGPKGYQAIMQGLAKSNVTEVTFICCDMTTPIFEIIGNSIGDTKLLQAASTKK